jgi:hypothetical protein
MPPLQGCLAAGLESTGCLRQSVSKTPPQGLRLYRHETSSNHLRIPQ